MSVINLIEIQGCYSQTLANCKYKSINFTQPAPKITDGLASTLLDITTVLTLLTVCIDTFCGVVEELKY